MATRKPSRQPSGRSRTSPSGSGSRGLGSFLLGILVTACVAGGALVYLHIPLRAFHPHHARKQSQTAPPASVASDADSDDSDDKPKPPALGPPPATAARAPFPISEDVFEAGARLYVKPSPEGTSCATCHGTPNRIGAKMPELRPAAAQFFEPQSPATHSPSQLFVRTKYGVSGAPGMPAYAGTLNDTEIWQIALLLSNAGQAYPDPVTKVLAKHR